MFSTRGGDQNGTCQTRVLAECVLPASKTKRSFRKEAMAAGVQKSGFLVLFLSEGVLTRPFVLFELEEAVRAKKTVLFAVTPSALYQEEVSKRS